MIRFIEANALKALWTITILNLGGGSLVWLLNAFRGSWAQIDPLDDLSRSEREDILQSAMSWQLLAVPTIEFGILVLVVTLAVAAIVSSARGSAGADSGASTPPPLDEGESEKNAPPLSLDGVEAERKWLESEMDDAKQQWKIWIAPASLLTALGLVILLFVSLVWP